MLAKDNLPAKDFKNLANNQLRNFQKHKKEVSLVKTKLISYKRKIISLFNLLISKDNNNKSMKAYIRIYHMKIQGCKN